MRKLLDGKSSTASKRKTSLWKCPFVLEFIFHLEFLLAFLANVLIFFKCLKVNESHILFSQPPRCECFRVEEGKLHNELHTIVKNSGKFLFFVAGDFKLVF
jgi:hypothetical protein